MVTGQVTVSEFGAQVAVSQGRSLGGGGLVGAKTRVTIELKKGKWREIRYKKN